jgi:hypothetical protein
MKRNSIVSAVVLVIFLLALTTSSASATYRSITVYKYDAAGNPIEGWHIQVFVSWKEGIWEKAGEGFTDENGVITFTDVTGANLPTRVWEEGRACWEPVGTLTPWEGGYYVDVDLREGDGLVEFYNKNICEPPASPGTGTPGYWKNHPEAWPVEEITIGGLTYAKEDAIATIKTPERGDKTYTMFRALVAAKLNVLIGNDDSCIAATITAADEWMAMYGPAGSGVAGDSPAWMGGEPLYEMLDAYNNGLLCAPARD